MKIYICEICGDAYIGEHKPSDCPFCGASGGFIKEGYEANPIVNQKIELSEISKKNLLETIELEMKANAIYTCMAGQSDAYEIKVMYKDLAKVELEHANVARKLLGMDMPEKLVQSCDEEDIENFKKTIELEDHAVEIYKKFAGEASEDNIRKFFGALIQIEQGHADLIKSLL